MNPASDKIVKIKRGLRWTARLLIPEPGAVAAPQPAEGDKAAADGTARPAVVPRGQSGRTLPPR